MTVADAFLYDIIAHPEADDLRLIYADYLEDHGQSERGEFIRVQCELAKLPSVCSCGTDGDGLHRSCSFGRRRTLRRREGELLGAHSQEWQQHALGDLAALATRFRRGFVAEITLPLAVWVGERCPKCGGRGHIIIDDAPTPDSLSGLEWPCDRCLEVGVTGRYGPRLIRAAPLEVVRFSDREPLQMFGDQWCWHQHEYDDLWPQDRPFLPHAVFQHLKLASGKVLGVPAGTPAVAPFPSSQAALDALSLAGLQWARLAAELEDVRQAMLRLGPLLSGETLTPAGRRHHPEYAALHDREARLIALVG